MKRSITKFFSQPTALEHARRRLVEHQCDLVEARRIAQAAAANVQYHERTLADLQRTINELGKSEVV